MTNPESHSARILELEFEYAGRLALASQDERARAVAWYLFGVGSAGVVTASLPVLAASHGSDLAGGPYPLLFMFLALVGVFTVVRIVRLRRVWWDCVLAMSQIKEYYQSRFPEVKVALRWRPEMAMPPGRLWTTAFDQALLVIVVDSVAVALAVHASGFRISLGDYAVDLFAALVLMAWQLFYYFYQLPASA